MKKMAAIATVVCVLVPTMQVWAQEAGGDAAGGYLGEVIGRGIHVRSGPAAPADYCVQFSPPAKVTGLGKAGGGGKSNPPPGGCRASRLSMDAARIRPSARSAWERMVSHSGQSWPTRISTPSDRERTRTGAGGAGHGALYRRPPGGTTRIDTRVAPLRSYWWRARSHEAD